MSGKDFARYVIATAIGVAAAVYVSKERPSPVPWFWHTIGRAAHSVGTFANIQYQKAIQ